MEKITKSEIKEIINEEKISPSELFGVEILTNDPLVKGYVDAIIKETQGKLRGEAEQRRRGEEGLDKTRKEWEDKKKLLEDENTNLKLEAAKVKAIDLFVTKMKERKLTKQQMTYIDAKKENFTPKDIEKLDSEVDQFLDVQVKDCKAMGTIFGVKEEIIEPKGGAETSDGGDKEEDFTPD